MIKFSHRSTSLWLGFGVFLMNFEKISKIEGELNGK